MTETTKSSKAAMQSDTKAVGWKTVSVFVSSTFDDMHAERDYLVKEVFPRLREWCEQRRLRLVDVDLRWGVTEADATNNKRVVDVCLRRIDDCRPFFICLLGQRYGWIPRRQDVAAETSGAYPHIAGVLGAASVTEMEIQHSAVEGKRVSDAFFYLRDPSYLADLPSDPAQLRQRIYTDEAEEDAAERKEKLRVLREEKIPATGRPVRQYSVRWNAELRTPEIALPPQCPATLPENIKTWQENWQRWAKVSVVGTDVNEKAGEGAKAAEHNEKLTRGRLSDFAVGERPLGEAIFEDLRQAIAARFPDHVEAGEQTDLQRELDLQEELIASATEGFIGRAADLAALDEYADGDDARLFAVAAAGGIGKTTLLAKWIASRRNRGDTVFCRFIGVGDRSSSVDSLLASLVDELREAERITSEIPTDPRKLREKLPELLAECGKHGRAIIVVDALNQLDSGLGDLDWLPKAMPAGLKIVVSFKTGTPAADDLLAQWRAGDVHVHECRGFESIEDRKKLVTGYLERHLKELDQAQLATLVTVPGAENPLYLRVVLGELRVFGAFGQLREKLAHDFGTTPVEAFAGVLRRLESDPAHAAIPPATSVPLIFGFLAHAHGGLPESAIVDLVETEVNLGSNRRRDVAASVALVLRQLRPYLAHREGRIDFFFESFHLAAKQRYTRPDAELPVRSESAWHDALANWCAKWERLEGASQRYALRWLPTHQLAAGRSSDAAEAMTDFGYHHARLEKLGANDVIEVTRDFTTLAKATLPADWREAVEIWQRFHNEIAHFLRRPCIRPEVELMQKAYAHADTSPVAQDAEAWLDNTGSKHRWFRKLSRPNGIQRNAWLRVLEGHSGGSTSVAIYADGRRAVSGGQPGALAVWDLNAGVCLRVLERFTFVKSVAVFADGRRALTGHWDKTLRVWDLDTGACLRVLAGHTAWVNSVAVCEDSQCAVSAAGEPSLGRKFHSNDETLRVWDLDTGACLHVFKGHSKSITSVAVFANGHRAISGSDDKTLRVWNLDAGAWWRTLKYACLSVLRGHSESVTSVAVFADGRRALSGSWDNTLRVWDLDTSACLRVLDGHTKAVHSVAVCADGRRAVSGGDDGPLRVWDLEAATCPREREGHTDEVTSIAVCMDGRRAISGSRDRTLRVWDMANGKCLRVLNGHKDEVQSVAVCADGRRAVSIAWLPDNIMEHLGMVTREVRVWNLDTGECIRVFKGHSFSVAYAVCPDDRRAISCGDYKTLRVWDLDTGKCLRVLSGHGAPIRSVAVSADSRHAVTGSDDKTLRAWDLDAGTCLRVLTGHTDKVSSIAVFGDGRRAVSGSNDKTLRVWDLDTGTCLRVLVSPSYFNSVVVCADGRRAFSGGGDGSLRVWDLDSGACLGVWCGETDPLGVALGIPRANGRVRIVARVRDDVHFFELMPPGPLTRTTFATWSPTHPLIATVLDTGAIALHQWHASSAQLEPLGHSPPVGAPISSLRFSLDGTRLQVLTADKTEHILDATTLQPAPPPASAWAPALLNSHDGAWRAVLRDGRLVVETAKP